MLASREEHMQAGTSCAKGDGILPAVAIQRLAAQRTDHLWTHSFDMRGRWPSHRAVSSDPGKAKRLPVQHTHAPVAGSTAVRLECELSTSTAGATSNRAGRRSHHTPRKSATVMRQARPCSKSGPPHRARDAPRRGICDSRCSQAVAHLPAWSQAAYWPSAQQTCRQRPERRQRSGVHPH